MLGPLTVEPAFESRGIGAALMRRALDAAKARGHTLVLLVGDEPYYSRFGFKRIPPQQLQLPGPVNPLRFLALELVEGALAGAKGLVSPLPDTGR
jgi:predicted N-acetyltransferase YhbS